MANTFQLIEAKTLSSTTATVSFTSIPQTFTDLKLMISSRSSISAVYNYIQIRLNSDTSSTVSFYTLYSVAGSVSTANTTDTGLTGYAWTSGNSATTNLFGNWDMYIPNYTSTVNKALSFDFTSENNSASGNILGLTNAGYPSSAAINRIDVSLDPTNSFLTNSTFYLYGIKNS